MEQMTVGGIFSKKDQLEAAKLQLKKLLENSKDDVQTIAVVEARIKELEKDVNLGEGDIASIESLNLSATEQLAAAQAQLEMLKANDKNDEQTIKNLEERIAKLEPLAVAEKEAEELEAAA